jgi:O-antigen ligase
LEEEMTNGEWVDVTQSQFSVSRFSSLIFAWLLFVAVVANLLYGAVSNGALGLLAIMTALTVVFWLADALFTKELGYSTSSLQIPIAGLIVIGLIQLLPLGGAGAADQLLSISSYSALTIDPFATRLAVLKLLIFLVFFSAALTYLDSPKRLRYAVFVLIVFGSVMSFFGILQKLSNPELVLWIRQVDYATPFATYVNQHHFASFLVMTSALALGLLFAGSTKPDKRILLVIAVILMGLGIVFTSSRGAMLGLISVILFLTALSFWFGSKTSSKQHRKTHFRRVWVLVGACALLVVFLLFSVSYLGGSDVALRSAGVLGPADVSNGRLEFWSTTGEIIWDNPIIGTGLDTYMTSYTKYDGWNGTIRVNHAHNEYLQYFSEGGIFAFLLVIAFIVLLFKKSFKIIGSTHHPFRRGIAAGALAACFGIIVHSFFDFPLRTNANGFFFLICAALATVPVDFPGVVRKKKRIKVRKDKNQ